MTTRPGVLLLLAAVLAVLTSPSWASGKEVVVTETVQLGLADAFLAEGEYYRAITEYKKFLFLFPDSGKADYALFGVGTAYYRGEEYEPAARTFVAVLEKYGKGAHAAPSAYFEGVSLWKLGRFDRAEAAFDRVASDDPGIGLVLTGPVDRGPGAESLRRAIDAAAARDRIRTTGVLPPPDVPAVFRGAEAVLLATRHEGFGLPVVEAFASGVPVVTTAAPAIAEVAGDAALLVPVDRPEALSEAVGRLLRDEALARELRARGLERASRFDEAAVARSTLRVLESVSGALLVAPGA